MVFAAIADNYEHVEENYEANLFVGSLKNGTQIIQRGKYIVCFAASELVMDSTSLLIH